MSQTLAPAVKLYRRLPTGVILQYEIGPGSAYQYEVQRDGTRALRKSYRITSQAAAIKDLPAGEPIEESDVPPDPGLLGRLDMSALNLEPPDSPGVPTTPQEAAASGFGYVASSGEWDESKVTREPAGIAEGGQFTTSPSSSKHLLAAKAKGPRTLPSGGKDFKAAYDAENDTLTVKMPRRDADIAAMTESTYTPGPASDPKYGGIEAPDGSRWVLKEVERDPMRWVFRRLTDEEIKGAGVAAQEKEDKEAQWKAEREENERKAAEKEAELKRPPHQRDTPEEYRDDYNKYAELSSRARSPKKKEEYKRLADNAWREYQRLDAPRREKLAAEKEATEKAAQQEATRRQEEARAARQAAEQKEVEEAKRRSPVDTVGKSMLELVDRQIPNYVHKVQQGSSNTLASLVYASLRWPSDTNPQAVQVAIQKHIDNNPPWLDEAGVKARAMEELRGGPRMREGQHEEIERLLKIVEPMKAFGYVEALGLDIKGTGRSQAEAVRSRLKNESLSVNQASALIDRLGHLIEAGENYVGGPPRYYD